MKNQQFWLQSHCYLLGFLKKSWIFHDLIFPWKIWKITDWVASSLTWPKTPDPRALFKVKFLTKFFCQKINLLATHSMIFRETKNPNYSCCFFHFSVRKINVDHFAAVYKSPPLFCWARITLSIAPSPDFREVQMCFKKKGSKMRCNSKLRRVICGFFNRGPGKLRNQCGNLSRKKISVTPKTGGDKNYFKIALLVASKIDFYRFFNFSKIER